MASTTSKTVQTAPTAEAFEAFAAFLRTNTDAKAVGADGNFTDWFASDAGQAAMTAFDDQKNAEVRSLRMGWARAVARDFKRDSKITTYSGDRAQSLLAYLQTVDFTALPDPAEVATDDDDASDAS